MTQRLIETWLPIAQIGIESLRERTPMTPFPAPNRLHVWWARRPLVASRAAILASLLPADADRNKFIRMLGIHGDPVATRMRIDAARKTGERLGANVYGYPRAFGYSPTLEETDWFHAELKKIGVHGEITVLDPTAGGGSIPLEAVRLGAITKANDLNPVAGLILRASVEWPATFGYALKNEFDKIAREFLALAEPKFSGIFPPEHDGNRVDGYLWSRTIICPYCDGLIPLSPNWRLASDGTGVMLIPDTSRKRCDFRIVKTVAEQSEGTMSGGDAKCPYPECGRIVDGGEVKRQAQAGKMGEQLYAVVFKQRIETKTKTGKTKVKLERHYRAPLPQDDNSQYITELLAENLPGWEANGVIPVEAIADPTNYERGHRMYGMTHWRHLFSSRQLACHGMGVEAFHEIAAKHGSKDSTDLSKAALVF